MALRQRKIICMQMTMISFYLLKKSLKISAIKIIFLVLVRSSQNPQCLTDPHTLLTALKPHLVSQMMFCCINVQRVIKVQKVLEQRQRKRYEGKKHTKRRGRNSNTVLFRNK